MSSNGALAVPFEKKSGDMAAFSTSWKSRQETQNNYFVRGRPQNQIQLAFRQHWLFLKDVIGVPSKGKSLEVGCGRGSISSYFAENGYKVSLLDLSPDVIEVAKQIYKTNKHDSRAEFVVGDALNMPFPDGTFDVVTSIGLLEHFADVKKLLSEQVRILKKGGYFTAYVVPQKKCVNDFFAPINALMKELIPTPAKASKKSKLFRTTYDSAFYKKVLKALPVKNIQSSGVYPFPAISPSPDFPFTLMPPKYEKALTETYENLLAERAKGGKNPWACSEEWGPTFFLWARKK